VATNKDREANVKATHLVVVVVVLWLASQQARTMYENWIMATVVIVGGTVGWLLGMALVSSRFGMPGLIVYLPIVVFFATWLPPLLLVPKNREKRDT
jgi:hypothetical protein